MARRLTYKRNGQWFYAADNGPRRFRWHPGLLFFRACDRVFVGPDNGRNHW